MANGQAELLRQVHELFRAGRVGDATDTELLGRFASQRDDIAFTALVTRHGSMVLRVCQGVLQDQHAAEDAFQATFLVLAHKAHRLHAGETLSQWLHGVALRVAKKAKSQNASRQQRDRHHAVAATWEPSGDPDRSDTEALLHEEVDRLPESYRVPIVLCYLQGLSYAMAANQLGISEGTIRGRLARARDRLRKRLTRRGVVVPAGFLVAGDAWTSSSASAAVPNSLVDSVAQGALQTIAGQGAVSASVMVLTKGVLRTMFLTQFKIAATAALLTVGGLLASKPLLINSHANSTNTTPSPPKSATQRATPDPQPKPADSDNDGEAKDEPVLIVESPPKPWETCVRINFPNNGGTGSGTVIQSTSNESLIITSARFFNSENKNPYTPEKFPHTVKVDIFDGKFHKPNDDIVWSTFTAKLVDYDLDRDICLLRIHPNRILAVSPIVRPWWGPQKGMKMMTAGFSNGGPATFWTTQVIDPKVRFFANSPYDGIQCEFAPKPGRSGGGLFTLDGFLAGVCNYAEPQGNRGYYATPESIYQLLNRNGLAALYGEKEPLNSEDATKNPTTSRPSPNPVPDELNLESMIRRAEQQLRDGDHQGARVTTDRLNRQLRSQQEALRLKLEHLDSLARQSNEIRLAADKKDEAGLDRASTPRKPIKGTWSASPSQTIPPPHESGSAPPDHEQRLRDLERKLEQLLEERAGSADSPASEQPGE
ncbi:RNA polymerase sigma factor, sigma-70 family [Singulisphaera sp. GP187]|uniref:sigma-70 family RNA polymerase sigma factor n=1 Tax=Singulisphaera sp. GP187 TaxID=1882752 RepID=UPI00092BD41A|nr:sigma-70 family RNA polymerase sigma factor [Singulisphaera sp. GP187]SIO55491.1 RNA polymerase sigma factor, sigma-70 family [Singulisphaera sp. GP187]